MVDKEFYYKKWIANKEKGISRYSSDNVSGINALVMKLVVALMAFVMALVLLVVLMIVLEVLVSLVMTLMDLAMT